MILSAQLLAEAQQTGGGTAWFLPVMLLVMVLLLWLPMRRQKKAQAQIKQKQATMGPGTRVMTSFGLFGTVQSIDRDENKAVLEVSPGTSVTVHTQTVTTVVDEPLTETAAPAQGGAAETQGSTSIGGHAPQTTSDPREVPDAGTTDDAAPDSDPRTDTPGEDRRDGYTN